MSIGITIWFLLGLLLVTTLLAFTVLALNDFENKLNAFCRQLILRFPTDPVQELQFLVEEPQEPTNKKNTEEETQPE